MQGGNCWVDDYIHAGEMSALEAEWDAVVDVDVVEGMPRSS